jgi:hypothetical protein
MERFRVFGECAAAGALVIVTLIIGFGALMAVSTQALQLASLN